MIYVLSDIHGHMPRFKSILRQIKLKDTDTLYILGDVIDRNPDGVKILKMIMKMPNVKMLRGNHEHMLLDALYYHPYPPKPAWRDHELRLWYRNGGEITNNHWKHSRLDDREKMTQYLLRLPINIDIEVNGKPYKLVHGKALRANPVHNETEEDLIFSAVWDRYLPRFNGPKDTTVIFGHTPTAYYQTVHPYEVWFGNNLIGIDCGCAYPEGRLACIRLDDMKVFYSKDPEGKDK